jgi:hypothetical protein
LSSVSSTENARNRRKHDNCSSEYTGVYWNQKLKRWIARISVGKLLANGKHKQIYLGDFISEIDAAHAYDEAIIKYDAKFFKLNFPQESFHQGFAK